MGGFFLGAREGGFTDADEETLVLFAQQAVAAIVNARAHRAERRARADLEALVETCPVRVVVLDAASGAPLTFNREARRIAAGLHTEGRSEAALLGQGQDALGSGRVRRPGYRRLAPYPSDTSVPRAPSSRSPAPGRARILRRNEPRADVEGRPSRFRAMRALAQHLLPETRGRRRAPHAARVCATSHFDHGTFLGDEMSSSGGRIPGRRAAGGAGSAARSCRRRRR